MPNILSIENLSCEKGEQFLFENLNFSLEEGEAMQIRGVNGSGKTSLLRIIAGVGFATEGKVLWNKQPIQKIHEEYCASLNYIGHKLGLKDDLTAYENLQFSGDLLGRNSTSINAALQTLGIDEKSEVLIRTLSAGQKRRAALAKLILYPAKLWILDEPFTAIDKEGTALLMNLMETHLNNAGMILFTSHQDMSLRHQKKDLYL